MQYSIKLYKDKHFFIEYEDYKHGLFNIMLYDFVESWLLNNLKNDYFINWEDINWNSNNIKDIDITFSNIEDYMAFKLKWV